MLSKTCNSRISREEVSKIRSEHRGEAHTVDAIRYFLVIGVGDTIHEGIELGSLVAVGPLGCGEVGDESLSVCIGEAVVGFGMVRAWTGGVAVPWEIWMAWVVWACGNRGGRC